MPLPAHVLLFGHDADLMNTREMILKRMGLGVETMHTLHKLKPALTARHVKLLVLCHTLSKAERSASVSLAASFLPEVRLLALETGWGGYPDCPLAQVLHTSSGPQEFCSAVQSLVNLTQGSPWFTERKTSMALEGTVAWFNNAKGYGFLGRKDGGADVFAHYSAIQSEGYKSLKQGDEVTFEVIQGEKGLQADQVHLSKKL